MRGSPEVCVASCRSVTWLGANGAPTVVSSVTVPRCSASASRVAVNTLVTDPISNHVSAVIGRGSVAENFPALASVTPLASI